MSINNTINSIIGSLEDLKREIASELLTSQDKCYKHGYNQGREDTQKEKK